MGWDAVLLEVKRQNLVDQPASELARRRMTPGNLRTALDQVSAVGSRWFEGKARGTGPGGEASAGPAVQTCRLLGASVSLGDIWMSYSNHSRSWRAFALVA